MSNVTNIIITSLSDSDTGKIADYLSETYNCANAPLVSDFCSGGNKSLECSIRALAINYFELQDLLIAMGNMKFECPESLQLFINEQDEDRFKEVWK